MLAMQRHYGKKQKQQIKIYLIARYANLYLRIILTRLKQEREFGPFQRLGLRGHSILGP